MKEASKSTKQDTKRQQTIIQTWDFAAVGVQIWTQKSEPTCTIHTISANNKYK